MKVSYVPELVVNFHCKCAENPLWDDRRKLLFWNDIPNGKIYCYDPASGKSREYHSGEIVGGFTLQQDGSMLLFEEKTISRLEEKKERQILIKISDPGAERFNDVIADPEGRVYAGTIGKTEGSGSLYRVDHDGSVHKLFTGTQCPNGMCFTHDRKHFFWTCTMSRKIFRFHYNQKTGGITGREVWADVPEEDGLPDGMTMDQEGGIWSARWGGSQIARHGPEGNVLERIPFPVSYVTSLIFAGDDLRDLYVTTAAWDGKGGGEGGALYRIRGMKIPGLPEFRSKILC